MTSSKLFQGRKSNFWIVNIKVKSICELETVI